MIGAVLAAWRYETNSSGATPSAPSSSALPPTGMARLVGEVVAGAFPGEWPARRIAQALPDAQTVVVNCSVGSTPPPRSSAWIPAITETTRRKVGGRSGFGSGRRQTAYRPACGRVRTPDGRANRGRCGGSRLVSYRHPARTAPIVSPERASFFKVHGMSTECRTGQQPLRTIRRRLDPATS